MMQIANSLKAEMDWAKSTSTTMISRMEAKGLIYHKVGGKAKLFYPAIKREDVVIKETRDFLNKIYKGSVGMLMNTLVEGNNLTKEDIEELYQILQKAEEENHLPY